MNTTFYTIMKGNKEFLSSNLMKGGTADIIECIKFNNREDAEDYIEMLRDSIDFKIIEVQCTLYL